jgi:hypothetical protein
LPVEIEQQRSARFVVAHRAGNDIDRLRAAEALGCALIECDVRLFHGKPEVRHLKTIGPLPIFWDRWTLANPFARRLLLPELLQALAPGTELMLDLKGRDGRLADLVVSALARRPEVRHATICARSLALLDPFRERPGITTVYSIGRRRQLQGLTDRWDGRRFDAVSIHERLLDRETVRLLGRYADVVMTWPVRTAEQARRLLAWGVRGLITDAPEEILPAIGAAATT